MSKYLEWTQGLFGDDYRVAMHSILYLIVSGIIKPNLKSIRPLKCSK